MPAEGYSYRTDVDRRFEEAVTESIKLGRIESYNSVERNLIYLGFFDKLHKGAMSVSSDHIASVCESLGINPDYVNHGRGDWDAQGGRVGKFAKGKQAKVAEYQIADTGRYYENLIRMADHLADPLAFQPMVFPVPSAPFIRRVGDASMVRFRGQSMAPTIGDGEVLVLEKVKDRDYKEVHAGVYFFVLEGGKMFVRRVIDNDGSTIIASSDNASSPLYAEPMHIDIASIRYCYKVVSSLKSLE